MELMRDFATVSLALAVEETIPLYKDSILTILVERR
jgi:hypothetical protein